MDISDLDIKRKIYIPVRITYQKWICRISMEGYKWEKKKAAAEKFGVGDFLSRKEAYILRWFCKHENVKLGAKWQATQLKKRTHCI